jgi:hypothetical protein
MNLRVEFMRKGSLDKGGAESSLGRRPLNRWAARFHPNEAQRAVRYMANGP